MEKQVLQVQHFALISPHDQKQFTTQRILKSSEYTRVVDNQELLTHDPSQLDGSALMRHCNTLSTINHLKLTSLQEWNLLHTSRVKFYRNASIICLLTANAVHSKPCKVHSSIYVSNKTIFGWTRTCGYSRPQGWTKYWLTGNMPNNMILGLGFLVPIIKYMDLLVC